MKRLNHEFGNSNAMYFKCKGEKGKEKKKEML